MFASPVDVSRLSLTFQGGFVGTRCAMEAYSSEYGWQRKGVFYPEDVNRAQTFELAEKSALDGLKLLFEESSDFFGRITLYSVELF